MPRRRARRSQGIDHIPATSEWIERLESIRAGGQHVLLTGNLHDLYLDANAKPLVLADHLGEHFEHQGAWTLRYSLATGIEIVGHGEGAEPTPLPTRQPGAEPAPEVELPALTTILRDRPVVLIIDQADLLVPMENAAIHRELAVIVQTIADWGRDPLIRTHDSLVVLCSPQNQVHHLIHRSGSGFVELTVPLPAADEIARFMTDLLEPGRANRPMGRLADDLTAERAADLAGGLRLIDIYALHRERGVAAEPVTPGQLVQAKATSINTAAGGILQVHELEGDLPTMAGAAHIAQELELSLASNTPPGKLLLVGPPGTGKSFAARVVALTLSLALVSMRQVRSQWVGESERNLETALRVLSQLSPVVCWIDEIDQALGQRSTGQSSDGGTSERLLARLLEYMGDVDGDSGVVWVATSNRPDVLDSAIEDRFATCVPLIGPSVEEIIELLPVLATQQGMQLEADLDLSALASELILAMPSIRLLAAIVQRAGKFAGADRCPYVTREHLDRAARDVARRADPIETEFLTLLALSKTSFQSLQPWAVRGRSWTPHPSVDAVAPIGADGVRSLDDERLRRRLDELAEQRQHRRWLR